MNKIEALKKTIYNLENDVYEYDWVNVNCCNCGILARTLLNGKSPRDCGYFDSPLEDGAGVFASQAYCMTTNLPLPEVFKVLKNAGFSHKDLLELEYLGRLDVLAKMGKDCYVGAGGQRCISDNSYDNKQTVIEYMKAWVEILEAEQVKVVHVYHKVEVPATLETSLPDPMYN